jgi:hypothetical protein
MTEGDALILYVLFCGKLWILKPRLPNGPALLKIRGHIQNAKKDVVCAIAVKQIEIDVFGRRVPTSKAGDSMSWDHASI